MRHSVLSLDGFANVLKRFHCRLRESEYADESRERWKEQERNQLWEGRDHRESNSDTDTASIYYSLSVRSFICSLVCNGIGEGDMLLFFSLRSGQDQKYG